MKNYQKVFHPKGIIYVVLSMIMVIIGMAVLFTLASCSLDQNPFHEHSWGEGAVTNAATCTEDGELTYTCACGETKTEVIPALGHEWNDGEVGANPGIEITFTCTREGCDEAMTVVLEGEGTEESPYLIANVDDWNAFAKYTKYTISDHCTGKYFKLTDDLSVTRMAGAYIGGGTFSFCGKFDGDGHTITLDLDSSKLAGGGKEWNDGLALFMAIGDGCEIKNLTVAGTIVTDRKYCAGFSTRIVDGANVVIQNCRSNVTIISSVVGDTTSGGFYAVGRKNGVNVTFTNCLFDGNFISEEGTNFSGFVGFQHDDGGATLTFSGCAVILGEETSERLLSESGCYTFSRNDASVVFNVSEDTLYTTVFGNADRGKLAYLDPAEAATAANDAGKEVDSLSIGGYTLYYLTEATE